MYEQANNLQYSDGATELRVARFLMAGLIVRRLGTSFCGEAYGMGAAVTTVCVEVGSLTLLGSGYVGPAVCSSKEKLVDGTVRRKTGGKVFCFLPSGKMRQQITLSNNRVKSNTK